DQFVYSCVKNNCGAQCSTSADCSDGNPYTTDNCLANCLCEHIPIPYCGDGAVGAGEQCELPNTNNNVYCSQSTNVCLDTKLGVRDSLGNCNGQCGCVPDQFVYSCVKNSCGAQCSVNADCDDQNPFTTDTCLANCSCQHIPVPYCGDYIIQFGEQCEPPNNPNNVNCAESTSTCVNLTTGTRPAFGDCNGECACVNKPFTFACVKNSCGAQCSVNADCDDGNVHTTDSCLDNCSCQHIPIPYCGDNIVGSGETCELPNTNNNAYCGQSTSACQGNKTGTRDAFGNCDAQCGCVPDQFVYSCVKDSCGAQCLTNSDCDDQNPHTTDVCELGGCSCRYIPIPYCGDNIVGAGEQCELPNTNNNVFCSQSVSTCLNHSTGSRDAFGNCDGLCGCVPDNFVYSCVKNSCGAQCSTNADCDDGNPHTTDSCLDNCLCQHIPIPHCGDNIIQPGEQCELPGTTNNDFCPQCPEKCFGTKLGTRPEFGNCNSECGCTETAYSFSCTEGECGAECATDEDCEDQNEWTMDTCDNECMCVHEQPSVCITDGQFGDGHEFKCNPDGTFEQCEDNMYIHADECKEACGASRGCEGLPPDTLFFSCNKIGETFLRDECNHNCQFVDSEICDSRFTGCTADPVCNGVTAGTDGCSRVCRALRLNVSSLQCFEYVIENNDQSCSVRARTQTGAAGEVTIKLFNLHTDELFGRCTTDQISGGCEIKYNAGEDGNYIVYATAEKEGSIGDFDRRPTFSYEVLDHRYDIINLRVFNNSGFSMQDYDFLRAEDMFVKFQVIDLSNQGTLVPSIITRATLVSPPGGRADLTELQSGNNWYYYELRPIPPTHDFLGLSQVFTFAFNFSDHSGGEKTVNLSIHNNLPRIIGNIGPLFTEKNTVLRVNLTRFEFDVEDHGNALTWIAANVNQSLFNAAVDWQHLLTITPAHNKVGGKTITMILRDLDGATAQQTVAVTVGHENNAPQIVSTPTTEVVEKSAGQFDALYRYQVVAIDPDGDTLTYLLKHAPAGMTINPTSGLIEWKPTKNQIGNNSVTVVVSDGELSDSQSFNILVRVPKVDIYPRRKIHIDTIRMDSEEYALVRAGDQIWVDLNFENMGVTDIKRATIRVTIEAMGISTKIGPFDGPEVNDVMHKGLLLDIPGDTKPGVYTLRVTLTTDDGLQRVRHRDLRII
ncbi:MAG: putative Ig domain-containing protein, partial [Candidatus Woesearchaeota archaeon]